MIVFPNAKINLGLNILSKRDDGYHNIESIMLPIGWCDALEIVESEDKDTDLKVSGNKIDCDSEKNLVMKAYRKLQAEFNLPPVHIYLYKNIPDGAGLGGGSSDAAFTLRLLNSYFELKLSDEKLAEYAAQLGADCPFFIFNRPMLATGIGTELHDFDISSIHNKSIVVAKAPNTFVSTAEAYSKVCPDDSGFDLAAFVGSHDVKMWMHNVKNDFEEGVFSLQPKIAELKEHMLELGAEYAAMSGSGSAVFGIFDNDNMADHLDEHFQTCQYFAGQLMF